MEHLSWWEWLVITAGIVYVLWQYEQRINEVEKTCEDRIKRLRKEFEDNKELWLPSLRKLDDLLMDLDMEP